MTNGEKIIRPNSLGLDEMQQSCVELLTDALEEALKGRINSAALVVCMDGGIATVMAGKNGLALNIGCDDLKQKIHHEMFVAGNVAARPKAPSILKVRQ